MKNRDEFIKRNYHFKAGIANFYNLKFYTVKWVTIE